MRKNCILKGKWFEEIGSNPHSKGDIFSRFIEVFFEMKIFKNKRVKEIKKIMKKKIVIIIIIYIKLILNILIGN